MDEVPEGTRLTTSRALFDKGLPSGEVPRFASYGEPVFDSLLRHFSQHELPPCVRRLSIPIEEFDTEYVGYVVATHDEPSLRLLTQLSDLGAGLLQGPLTYCQLLDC